MVDRLRAATRTWDKKVMMGISTREIQPGVVEITINTQFYGQAGKHWSSTLSGPNNNGYGKLYIQRFGANQRRYWHCYGPGDWYKGEKGINQDECPGAMFIWTSLKEPSIEAVDAIENQKLGRDLGRELRKYPQKDASDLWEVAFRFI
jgi:hypothetical protein